MANPLMEDLQLRSALKKEKDATVIEHVKMATANI